MQRKHQVFAAAAAVLFALTASSCGGTYTAPYIPPSTSASTTQATTAPDNFTSSPNGSGTLITASPLQTPLHPGIDLACCETVAVADDHAVAICNTGRLIAAGDNSLGQCNVDDWTDIVSVSADCGFTVGLVADGTVRATGSNLSGQCDVASWQNVTEVFAVALGYSISSNSDTPRIPGYTLGVTADGSILTAGADWVFAATLAGWRNMKAIYCLGDVVVGLRQDGTAVSANHSDSYVSADVSHWRNVVDVTGYGNYPIGLTADGTIVTCLEFPAPYYYDQWGFHSWTGIQKIYSAAGYLIGQKADGSLCYEYLDDLLPEDFPDYAEIDFENMPRDIIDIPNGNTVFALRANGTAIAQCFTYDSACEGVDSWNNLVKVYATSSVNYGLRADGTLLSAGEDYLTPFSVSGFRNIKLYN